MEHKALVLGEILGVFRVAVTRNQGVVGLSDVVAAVQRDAKQPRGLPPAIVPLDPLPPMQSVARGDIIDAVILRPSCTGTSVNVFSIAMRASRWGS